MSTPSELTPEQRANLVPYLDDELDEEATLAMEQLLAVSAEARAEIEKLSSTWDLLDDLAQPQASPGFSEKTLATVKVQAVKGQWLSMRARRGVVATVWVVALALSAGVGFLATNRWMANPATTLTQELPLIQNLHVYSEIESVEFLTELRDSKLFHDYQAGKTDE